MEITEVDPRNRYGKGFQIRLHITRPIENDELELIQKRTSYIKTTQAMIRKISERQKEALIDEEIEETLIKVLFETNIGGQILKNYNVSFFKLSANKDLRLKLLAEVLGENGIAAATIS